MKWSLLLLAVIWGTQGQAAPAKTPTEEIDVQVGIAESLTAFRASLPGTYFADRLSEYAPIEEWRVEVMEGHAREIYLGYDPDRQNYVTVHGLIDKRQPLALRVFPITGPSMGRAPVEFTLDLQSAPTVDGGSLLVEWSEARRHSLVGYRLGKTPAGLMRPMLLRSARLYELLPADEAFPATASRRRRRGRQGDNVFSLFSGQSAIEETLQQQLLESNGSDDQLAHSVGESVGPQITSHPFGEMLAGREVGTPAIASLVPTDRYLVHIDNMGAALDWLDRSAASGLELTGLKLGTYVAHDLVDGYLSRLHFSRALVEKLARTGVIEELALFGPDLYLQHGSELTVILNAEDSPALSLVFAPLIGNMLGASQDGVRTYGSAAGEPAFFAQHGQWLIFSTNESEASAALRLAKDRGKGSLGKSDEFQYMYSLLTTENQASGLFVYFSDPFIRSMVGPKTKILQLRRHQA